jgi:hypothetical protein
MYGQLIATQTVGAGGVSSIVFSSLPQTFTDLVVVYSGIEAGLSISFNSITAGYSRRYLYGTGSSVATGSGSSESAFSAAFTYWGATGELVTGKAYIPNYAGSTNKSISVDMVTERNAANSMLQIFAGTLANTAAVTSVTLTGLGTIPQYSTASIYGLLKGSGGATAS